MKKLFILVFGLLLTGIILPIHARAFTLKDLMLEITSLKTEVGALKNKLGAQAIINDGGIPVPGTTNTQGSTIPQENYGIIPDYINTGGGTPVNNYPVPVPPQAVPRSIPTNTTPITTTLRPGLIEDIGVLNLQTALQNVGLLKGPIDGNFGPATTNAVKQLQIANGLTPDGIVGAQTRDLINNPKLGVILPMPPVSNNTGTVVNPKITINPLPPVSNNTGTVASPDIDTYIRSLPKLIASYQSILKDPVKYKAEAISLAPKTPPQIESGGIMSRGSGSGSGGGSLNCNYTCVNVYGGGSNGYAWQNGIWRLFGHMPDTCSTAHLESMNIPAFPGQNNSGQWCGSTNIWPNTAI